MAMGLLLSPLIALDIPVTPPEKSSDIKPRSGQRTQLQIFSVLVLPIF